MRFSHMQANWHIRRRRTDLRLNDRLPSLPTLFSPSLPDFRFTAPSSWPTQKYRLFCGQISRAKMEAFDRRGTNLVWWQSTISININLCYIAGNFFPTARSHWLLRGHMSSKNETVSRQNLWAGNIAKNLWRHTVTEHCYSRMLTDHRRYSEVYWISSFKIFSYITNHLKSGPSGNKINCFPQDQSLSVYY